MDEALLAAALHALLRGDADDLNDGLATAAADRYGEELDVTVDTVTAADTRLTIATSDGREFHLTIARAR